MRVRTVLALTAALVFTSFAQAGAELPSVPSGHRPGPDALYEPPPAEVPQLENAGPWRASPILVSGTQAYRGGEWLYQDFLHDDHGAAGQRDPGDPFGASADQFGPDAHLFAPTSGTMTYPTDPIFASNAADLVELRVRPLASETAFRVTLNTLQDPERTAFTVALGSSVAPRPWPHGAGVSSPAELFLTVHGATAELRDATSGAVRPGARASVDRRRRQVDVRVSHSAWDPSSGKVRVAVGVGLWDAAAGGYLAPAARASQTAPGGASPSGAALFNVGPRFDEPKPDITNGGLAPFTIGDAAVGSAAYARWWRDEAQADALRAGDASGFSADVDFGKLARGANDDSQVPKTGPIDRIMASRHQFGQGLDATKVCRDIAAGFSAGAKCVGRFVGQLQPYALYVPAKPRPKRGFGLTLLLHSLSANYNQYFASKNQSQLGDRAGGSLVATPNGRGPDGFYAGIAEADTFEVWADVARHYRVDPDWVTASGYSMGGFGTYRLLARWPDLFARGMSTVGIPGSADDQLPSLRNTPIMVWNAAGDELVNVKDSERAVQELTAAGVRFVSRLFPGADHLTLSTNDEYGPAAAFLGSHRVDRDPAHVTYVVDTGEDSSAARAIADHAYWVSALRVRDRVASPRATIDARSAAFGVGDPPVLGVRSSEGALEGGTHGPMPFHQREQEWGPAPRAAKAKELFVRATNLASATFDTRRARVGCAPRLDVRSDGPLELALLCPKVRSRTVRCLRTVSLLLPRIRGRRIDLATVSRGGRRIERARGRNIKRLTFARPSLRAFEVELRARAAGEGPPLTIALKRRFTSCAR